MKHQRIMIGLVLLLWLAAVPALFADERPPYDIVLVIDRSLSMEEEISTVKDFARNSIIDNNVQIGDYLVIIDFYGQAELLASFPVDSAADLDHAKQVLADVRVRPHDYYTDIGTAVDLAKAQVDKLGEPDKPKVILVITDGIQEAPPESQYYSPDGTFSHALLEKATTIAKEGWKIQVIDIGGTRMTRLFTESIGGEYSEVSEQPTEEELTQATSELTGIIQIADQPERLTVDADNQGTLSLTLESRGFSREVTVALAEVRLRTPAIEERDILTAPLIVDMPKDGEQTVTANLFFPTDMKPGDYQADVLFVFDDGPVFTPGGHIAHPARQQFFRKLSAGAGADHCGRTVGAGRTRIPSGEAHHLPRSPLSFESGGKAAQKRKRCL